MKKTDKFFVDKYWNELKGNPLFKGTTKKQFSKEYMDELKYIRRKKKGVM